MKKRLTLLLGLFVFCALVAFAGAADGTWTASSPAQGAPQSLTLQSTGLNLTGSADGVQISNGKIEQTTVWFTLVRSGVTYNYKGSVSGTVLTLHETLSNGTNHRTLQFNHN